MDEDERTGLVGCRPKLVEALIPKEDAARRRRDLDAGEPAVVHQLAQLLRTSEIDRPERKHTVTHIRRERLVLPLDVDPAEVDPRAQDDRIDTRAALLLDDAADVGELPHRGADLTASVAHDLSTVAPLDVGAEPGNDHMRVRVDDH